MRSVNQKNEYSTERNWNLWRIKLVRLGVVEKRTSHHNKAQTVSFNCNTLLEYVFDKQFFNYESGLNQQLEYRKDVEIVHDYGEMGGLMCELANPAKANLGW